MRKSSQELAVRSILKNIETDFQWTKKHLREREIDENDETPETLCWVISRTVELLNEHLYTRPMKKEKQRGHLHRRKE